MVLIACLGLFLSSKIEIARFQSQTGKSISSTTAGLDSLAAEIQQLRQSMEGIENTPSTPPGPGINLTRRAQVLKMHQRGEQLETIAGALRISRNEIELLLKLQKLAGPGEFGRLPGTERAATN